MSGQVRRASTRRFPSVWSPARGMELTHDRTLRQQSTRNKLEGPGSQPAAHQPATSPSCLRGWGGCPMVQSEDTPYPIRVPWLQIWREMATYRRIMGYSQNQRKAESADLMKDQAQVSSRGL